MTESRGECKKMPPIVGQDEDSWVEGFEGIWPIIGSADWCGEWKPKVSEATTKPQERCPGQWQIAGTKASSEWRRCSLERSHDGHCLYVRKPLF
jgi:hypothetical protein